MFWTVTYHNGRPYLHRRVYVNGVPLPATGI